MRHLPMLQVRLLEQLRQVQRIVLRKPLQVKEQEQTQRIVSRKPLQAREQEQVQVQVQVPRNCPSVGPHAESLLLHAQLS